MLGQLKEAAEIIGLPATRLLELCLVAAVKARKKTRNEDADGGKVGQSRRGRIRNVPDGNVKRTGPKMNDRARLALIVVPIATDATDQPPVALNSGPKEAHCFASTWSHNSRFGGHPCIFGAGQPVDLIQRRRRPKGGASFASVKNILLAVTRKEVVWESGDGDARLLGGSPDESSADGAVWSDTRFHDRRR